MSARYIVNHAAVPTCASGGSSRGATGPRGPRGPAGPRGPKGATGHTGPKGSNGLPGPKGATGATGVEGATGASVPVSPPQYVQSALQASGTTSATFHSPACPTGTKVVGGGYLQSGGVSDLGLPHVHGSFPDTTGNRWAVTSHPGGDALWQTTVYAVCAVSS
jgi:hypothetical protein